ncbi:MAG TPA: hypothetical protein DCQ80_09550 [Pseudomonas sp.]|nr:hypothetical protein [Pseudomonas sp.]
MNRLLLIVGGLGVLLVNAAFFWLNSAVPLTEAEQAAAEAWQLRPLVAQPVIKPEELVASGVWGLLPQDQQAATGQNNSEQLVEAREAQLLREQLRGIVRQGDQWRVLVSQGEDLQEVGIDQQLAGTRWRLVEIQPDRLLLRDGEQQRSLLLFPLPEETSEP